jgi:hypothetical protein
LHIDTEIEEQEEHIVSSSEDDDVKDETYRISPRAARGAAFDDDEDEEMEDLEDEPIRHVEDEQEEVEEQGAKGTANPQQRGRVPFPHKPTIRRPHKPLSYNVICY